MTSKIQVTSSPLPSILRTGLLAGTLDITAAFINSYIRSGVHPTTVLQFIASGILGQNAFGGGVFVPLLGLFLHYFIAFAWTILFFIVYPKIKLSSRYKIPVGLGYGVIIWIIMNIIVLPLSKVPHIPFRLSQFILGILFFDALNRTAHFTNVSLLLPEESTMKTREENIRDFQNRFDQAQVKGDFKTIENLIAPDIMFIGPKGYITDVEEWLTVHRNGEYKQTVMESIDADVRVYGNTAILYDLKNSECEYKGEVIKGIFRTTQVWIKQQDRWQLTSVQFIPISDH